MAAPICDDIEGESLQDVALSCSDGDANSCKALVLHRQGRRVSSCAIADHAATSPVREQPSAGIADAWLGEGDVVKGKPQEEITSISFAQECHEGGRTCAYVSTGNRVVEVQKGLAEESQ